MSRCLPALLLAGALALTGCTGGIGGDDPSSGEPSAPTDGLAVGDPTDTSMDVEFTPCGAGFPCAGQLGDSPYEIRLPEQWNGTLLIYSHGFRAVDPVEQDGPGFQPRAEVALGQSVGFDVIADELVDQGYALAGAGAPEGGWTVAGALDAVDALRTAFVENVGVPNRTFTWGDSLGAVASVRAGQEQPWADGTLALCGLLAGLNPNMDLALDVGVGVKALLAPRLKLTGFASAEEARAEYERAIRAITQAAEDPTGAGLVALQVIAATTETPTQSRSSTGFGPQGLAVSLVENLRPALARTTLERYRVEQDLGGNPSTNVGVNYGARVTQDEAEVIDALAGEGATLALVQQMASLPAVEADPAARAAGDEQFPRPAPLAKPLMTLHTSADPAAILANQTLFGQWAAQVSGEEIRWLNINVSTPPAEYPPGGAPYGAGNCNFTGQSVVGAVGVLNDWVARGRFPTWAGNAEEFGPGSGFAGPAQLPPWPDSPTVDAE